MILSYRHNPLDLTSSTFRRIGLPLASVLSYIKLAPQEGVEPTLLFRAHINSVVHCQLCYRGMKWWKPWELNPHDISIKSRMPVRCSLTSVKWWNQRELNPHDIPLKRRLPVHCSLVPFVSFIVLDDAKLKLIELGRIVSLPYFYEAY